MDCTWIMMISCVVNGFRRFFCAALPWNVAGMYITCYNNHEFTLREQWNGVLASDQINGIQNGACDELMHNINSALIVKQMYKVLCAG